MQHTQLMPVPPPCLARPHRRDLLAGLGATLLVSVAPALARSTETLQRGIDEATRAGRPFQLPAGGTPTGPLRLPDGARLVGHRGRSRLVAIAPGPLLVARKASAITLDGVTLDGADMIGDRNSGLMLCEEVGDLRIRDCRIERTGGNGVHLIGCGGSVRQTTIADVARGGLFAIDSIGLAVTDNVVERCGENGIQIWRSRKGHDGTFVSGNRIADIAARPGGTGEYGNAISLFRAGGVNVTGNHVRRAAYSAVRNNGGRNVVISGTIAGEIGECAIFVEFAFDGAVIAGNVVDGAYEGIQVANFESDGGRLATVTGNIIRTLREGRHPGDGTMGGGRGIFVEADAAVTGNVIEGAPRIGLQLGWGASLRDVTATGNTIRDVGIGIAVSVAPGAGGALVATNTVSGARRGAVVGMEWDRIATGDLTVGGAAVPRNLRLSDTLVR